MSVAAYSLFNDHKHSKDIIAALSDVQLSANTVARRVSDISTNLTEQLNRNLSTCRWFNVHCSVISARNFWQYCTWRQKTNAVINVISVEKYSRVPVTTGSHWSFVLLPTEDHLLNYHWIIHQPTICAKGMGFDHVLNPVMKIVNSVQSKATQHSAF